MTDVTADYLALRREVGAVRVPRAVLRVSGPDAVSYLQGQLSHDVEGLGDGEATRAFLLDPNGKNVAWLRASRVDNDVIVLDTDVGLEDRVVERLQRFKLRTRWEIESLEWECIAVRGPESESIDTAATGSVVRTDAEWPVLPGFDLIGPSLSLPDGVRECGLDAYEAVRIECGVPANDAELTESTIPNEAGRWVLDTSVSFTKGCYTGQELVMRIDSRGGNVPHPLRGVVIATNVLPPVGASIVLGGDTSDGADGRDAKEVGRLTSIAESLDRHAPVALAPVSRRVEPPVDVRVVWDDRSVPARVEELPLV